MKNILNGIIKENPIFSLMLGLCPVLAVTNKFENAYMMGLSFSVIMICSTIIIFFIKNIIPKNVKIPVYILIVGTFVTIVELILKKYVPSIYLTFNIYLSLIVVNCIVLGNLLSISKKQKFITTITKTIGTCLGFTLSLCLVALCREVLGSNTLTIMDSISNVTGYKAIYKIFPQNDILPMKIFNSPAGSFLILGLLLAIFNFWKQKRGERHEHN